MPSTDHDAETEPERPADADDRTEDEPTDGDRGSTGRVRRYVDYAILGGLLLLAFVAVVQFYLAAGSAINTWVTPEYRSLFRALFNLVVLLVVGGGIVYQLRRMDLGGRGTD